MCGCQHENELDKVVGTLEWDRIELTNEVSEPIVKLHVREGEKVNQGDVVLEFDKRRAQATLNSFIAIEEQLQARLDELVAGSRIEVMEQAKQAVVQAKSELHLAEIDLARIKALVKKNLTSQADLDNSWAIYKKAKAQLALEEAKLDALLAGTRKEQVEQARKALQSAQAQVAHQQINLEHLTLLAPAKGLVDSLPYKEGEEPKTGSVVAVMLVGNNPYARVYIPEPLRAQIKPGQSAKVFVDGVESPFSGRVRVVSNDPVFTPYYSLTEADRSRLAYLAKVDLVDDEANQLPAGLPLNVVFESSETAIFQSDVKH
ncbi:membrane protein [Thiomicrorhabdus immobilis]|uniref:Membrane protein n=2 Tax=Thiomicrorhabdus immobilis TaxID=2791037 RepID=A0ABN6CVU0_9GAMM|nr:membrane protein [Thiomicrorhabdus immobilis]